MENILYSGGSVSLENLEGSCRQKIPSLSPLTAIIFDEPFIVREGTPGHHEPPICRQEPPRFARHTEPLIGSNEHAQ